MDELELSRSNPLSNLGDCIFGAGSRDVIELEIKMYLLKNYEYTFLASKRLYSMLRCFLPAHPSMPNEETIGGERPERLKPSLGDHNRGIDKLC